MKIKKKLDEFQNIANYFFKYYVTDEIIKEIQNEI